jgi:thiamine biosynthesis lipoprotein
LLGTLVSIRVSGADTPDVHRAINAAFDEVAAIHALMSFHEPDSDVSRLNRDACVGPVAVDQRTMAVMAEALQMSRATGGVFDVSVGDRLATWGYLPGPHLGTAPDGTATWRDIELLPEHRIRFHRRLWIDLGGIAKGYAVDRAVERLLASGVGPCLVNAGGDLRVAGSEPERILLRLPVAPADGLVPAVMLTNAALAGSSGREKATVQAGLAVGPHVHGQSRQPVGLDRFTAVVADRCVVADALTKIVLANDPATAAILRSYNATAYLHDAREGWRTLGIGS